MQRPTNQLCQLAYRKIQAHCAIRVSTAVGSHLREKAGPTGDIGGLPGEVLRTLFSCPVRLTESQRLVELARMNTRRNRNGERNGEGKNG